MILLMDQPHTHRYRKDKGTSKRGSHNDSRVAADQRIVRKPFRKLKSSHIDCQKPSENSRIQSHSAADRSNHSLQDFSQNRRQTDDPDHGNRRRTKEEKSFLHLSPISFPVPEDPVNSADDHTHSHDSHNDLVNHELLPPESCRHPPSPAPWKTLPAPEASLQWRCCCFHRREKPFQTVSGTHPDTP